MINKSIQKWLSRETPQRSINSAESIPAVLISDIGLRRQENQDKVCCARIRAGEENKKEIILIALSDGMGGMLEGRECASLTISSLITNVIKNINNDPETCLDQSVKSTNEIVYNFSKGRGGATLSALLIDLATNSLYTLNIGDSRIYAFSKSTNEVYRLTVDDSLEEAVGGHGRELLQFIGMGDGIKPHIKNIHGDISKLFLTSDGLHFIEQKVLYEIIRNTEESLQLANRLSTLSRWCGGPDNCSLIIYDIEKAVQQNFFEEENSLELTDHASSLVIIGTASKENQEIKQNKTHINKTEEIKENSENIPEKNKQPQTQEGKKIYKRKPKANKAKKEENYQIVIEIDAEGTDNE